MDGSPKLSRQKFPSIRKFEVPLQPDVRFVLVRRDTTVILLTEVLIYGKAEMIAATMGNAVFETLRKLELPKDVGQDILKDEIITLSSKKAVKTGINQVPLRLIHVYKPDENKVIEIITNQLDWTARTIADLYKKRWDIELFFKVIKQNLQIKTFVGTSENAVKSHIYIALITYLLLQLIVRTIAKKKHAFSNFVEKIRICLSFYLTLDYVCNQEGEGAKKIRGKPQTDFYFKADLFSA